ncbi:MAG TPA: ABC transporter permease [Actinomycetota bacterium]|jgi:putative spermidine/putrescine transport system permease protein|nr:ABC transporter permease [Actinomycetota bacterium]
MTGPTRFLPEPRVSVPIERGADRRISAIFYRRPWLKLLLMLAPGLLWLGVLYLGSLLSLIVQGLYRLEEFTGLVVRQVSLATYQELLQPANLDIIFRTTGMAAAVTLACAVIAFPIAYYMAKFASSRTKTVLYLAVLMPLWMSYLVRVYSWKFILAKEGVLPWFVERLGLAPALDFLLGLPGVGGNSLSTSLIGMWLVFVYTWLPFMILPLAAALERVPDSFVEASGDLGARPPQTFRKVILPLALPGLVAGSIFTFSLTLGDFIIPTIIGNSAFFLGSQVLVQQGTAGNLPLAAAFSAVPMVVMVLYLSGAKRLGAFEAL